RFRAFQLPGSLVGILEHTAGFLHVDSCVRAMAEQARRLRAQLRENEQVLGWERQGSGFAVRTTQGSYSAARLILTAGPWAARLLGEAGLTLRVMRQVVFWVGARALELFRRDHFPIFIAETPEGYFYGLPALDERGIKVARHYGAPELAGPEEV